MMNNAVEVDDLVVVRGDREVLRYLSFTIPSGGVTGLLGPSGCGKTTLMRSLVGVQQLTSGSVTVLGEEAGAAPLRDRVGYVTQAASVYDDLTVSENLAFFARVLGVDRGRGRAEHRGRRPAPPRRPGGRQPQRRPAVARQPGRRAAQRARPAGARRADRRPRPGAAPGAVGAVPPARRGGRRGVRLQPRDGRGRALRPAAADARRPDHRRRQPGRRSSERPDRRHRGGVPGIVEAAA